MRITKIAVLLLLAATGCHKKNNDGTPAGAGSLLASCTAYPPKIYSGAVVEGSCAPLAPPCQTRHQYVSVQADVLTYPNDQVNVVLSRTDGTKECLPGCGTGSYHIELGRNQVGIVNGVEAGFTSYEITEQLCR